MIRLAPLLALLASACATLPVSPVSPQDQFMARLQKLCGKSFQGKVVSNDSADSDMRGQVLTMHVRQCSPGETRVPFHVGSDRSRTWVVTRTPAGLRLKHDHRHEDGSEDRQSQYGGDTVSPGTAGRQEFPADAFSRDLFVAEKIPQSATNVWAVEVDDRIFAYELRRPNRFFRVEFDLSRPVPAPPPPWGAR